MIQLNAKTVEGEDRQRHRLLFPIVVVATVCPRSDGTRSSVVFYFGSAKEEFCMVKQCFCPGFVP